MNKVKKVLNHKIYKIILILMIVVLLFSKTFMVSVYPNTTVVVEFANSIHKIKATPGPVFKMPWESVEIIMQKNLIYTSKPTTLITSDGIPIVVSISSVYNIDDIYTLKKSIRGDLITGAEYQIENSQYGELKNTVATYKYADMIGDAAKHPEIDKNKENIIKNIKDRTANDVKRLGITILDTYYVQFGIPEDSRSQIIKTITMQKQKDANSIIQQANLDANNMKNDKLKELNIEKNQANLYSQNKIAEAQKQAKAIYNSMYRTDANFYSLYKDLKALEVLSDNAKDGQITLEIPTDSEIGKAILGK
jgi:modulator of FtsH protease HflC